ncbi:E3 ubiquitin-protein ligase RNF144A isoform X3 [Balaenoptera ricei]|uniref:E3 ubiquitin-protein ligase RNF144A isoform X3 n=1 Tax=Balaenoptera ricei TaxID=2746895 RepID=UPI0028BEC059|nr:E3 ubiquitin-protein ligase RNF144A isoform X3 [Balaenoptera ricei]
MTTARCRPTWDLALDPLVSCKLCLGEYPVEQMTTIAQCQCIFCTLCLKQYVELLIKEGLETAISCPDAACPKQGHLQENEIECMVAAEIMQRYKKLQFEREVLLDPCRTWCPASTCQAVCQLQEMGLQTPQLVQCKACDTEFCSACKASWHPGQGCPETMPITFLPGETSSSAFPLEEDDVPIKRCPKCKVYIERDEGCAQMMCKNCKHAFCWYCLESLDGAETTDVDLSVLDAGRLRSVPASSGSGPSSCCTDGRLRCGLAWQREEALDSLPLPVRT